MKNQKDKPSYQVLADDIRNKIENGDFLPGSKMPTEAHLRDSYGVSRHTVREALKQIVSAGLVDQIQGSGTYVRRRPNPDGLYSRSIGSMDDLKMWPGTDTEIVQSFETHVDASVAARLNLNYVEVDTAILRRSFEEKPFVLTYHHVSPELGQIFREHGLTDLGAGTVIGAAEPFLKSPIAGVQQQINAIDADEVIGTQIGVPKDTSILLIERLYYDTDGAFIEFTESFFNPRRYAFRMDLQRKGRGS